MLRDLLLSHPQTVVVGCVLAACAGSTLLVVAYRMLRPRPTPVIVAEVVHVGATAQWSPIAAVEAVPHKPLGPDEARQVAEDHAAAIWEDQQRAHTAAFRALEVRFPRAIDDTFEGLLRRASRIGHLELDTCEIPRGLMAEVVARGAGR